MKTIKQLADIGAAAAFADNKRYHYMSVSEQSHSWQADEPARQAFAQAVKDAVMEDLVTNQISSPTEPVLVPLTMDDIRATDEFRLKDSDTRHVLTCWSSARLRFGIHFITYVELAANYLRRQHGSNEWKPCTKDETV